MSKEIKENFNYAINEIKSFDNKKDVLTNEEKLKFYGLYKQATIGKCNIPKPWAFNVEKCMKWNAWNSLGDMTKDEAMFNYCNLFIETKEKHNL
jgi:acyl-CoA-binding protein